MLLSKHNVNKKPTLVVGCFFKNQTNQIPVLCTTFTQVHPSHLDKFCKRTICEICASHNTLGKLHLNCFLLQD